MSLAKLRTRRAAAVAAGLCQVCCVRPHAPGRRRCDLCAQRHRAWQQGRRTPMASSSPFCLECLMAPFRGLKHRADCSLRDE